MKSLYMIYKNDEECSLVVSNNRKNALKKFLMTNRIPTGLYEFVRMSDQPMALTEGDRYMASPIFTTNETGKTDDEIVFLYRLHVPASLRMENVNFSK